MHAKHILSMVAQCRLNFQGWLILCIGLLVLILYYFSDTKTVGHLPGSVISVRRLLIECVHLAEDAGAVIKSNYKPDALKTRVKTGGSGPKNELLTQIDLKSHSVIVKGLSSSFPAVKVISEEHPPVVSQVEIPSTVSPTDIDSRLTNNDLIIPSSELTVWVDPLDATQELTEGLLQYVTVMICIAMRGHPIAGVIHQPFLGKTYWAWEANGLSKDLADLVSSRSKAVPKSDTLIITHSRSHLDDAAIKSVREAFGNQKVDFLPAGGSGFKVLQLLAGNATLYVHPSGTRRWDVCAPQAVLTAAGGRMTGLDGFPLIYSAQSEPRIPESVGLFAASTVASYDAWKSKLSVLLHKGKSV